MSKVAFSSTTALLGSAVRSMLQHAAQSVILCKLETPNATLKTPNATLDTHYSITLYAKALNAIAPNSIYRNLTGVPPQIHQACDVHRTIYVRLTVERRLVNAQFNQAKGVFRYG